MIQLKQLFEKTSHSIGWMAIFVFCITTRSAFAQSQEIEEQTEQGLGMGVHLGLSVAGANIDEKYNSERRVGFTVGVAINSDIISNILLLQPEINFVQRGAENTRVGNYSSTELRYLDFPLLAKVQLPIGNVTPYAVLGPKVGVLLGSSSTSQNAQSAPQAFSTFDVGYTVGIGSGFPFRGDNQFYVTARYEKGLLDIDESDASQWRSEEVRLLGGISF